MSTTLKLPYKRYVRQVVTGPRPKSTYLAMMAENLEKLKSAPWREADPSVQVGLVPHDFTRQSFDSDQYDAFKMTGAYDSEALTETAAAGIAAYRFKMPQAFREGSATVTKVAIPVTRDRFCRKGLRIAVIFGSNASTPDTRPWWQARGEAQGNPQSSSGYAAWSALTQESVEYLTHSAAGNDTIVISGPSNYSARYDFLWVFISLEDYEDRWEMYSEREARAYAIEGSGMVMGNLVEVEFDGTVEPDAEDDEAECLVAEAGNYPRLTGEATGVFATMRHLNGDAVPFGSPPAVAAGDVAAGRNALYADLIKQRLDPIPAAMLANGGVRPGAGFTVFRRTAAELPSDTLGDTITTPRWDLAVAVLSLPFVIPAGGKSIELEWTAPPPAAGLVRLWLRQGELDESPDPAALSAPALFTGAEPTVGGYVLVATAPASAGALSAPIPAPPSAPTPATLLVTAYAPPESIALDSADTAMGVAALSADVPRGAVSGLETLIKPAVKVAMR